jgi:putative intracellular protease/amidase
MKSRGHTFEVVSTDYVIQDEITMQPSRIKRTVRDVSVDELQAPSKFGAFMVVSGNMADTEAYWKDKRVLDFIEVANIRGWPIAAICCSVPTIRQAANEKKVSFFPLLRSRELLTRAGAILQTTALTRDQNLVTAEHQMASQMWAEEFCNLMEGKPVEHILQDSGYTPKGRERMPIPEVEAIKKAQGKELTVIKKARPWPT